MQFAKPLRVSILCGTRAREARFDWSHGRNRLRRARLRCSVFSKKVLMPKTKIALACQGGGSQTAFTAGAVKTLCQANSAKSSSS